MVSLWGSSKGGDRSQHDDDPGRDGESSQDRRAATRNNNDDANEHTRLLPPSGHAGYLDPNDPAVSPYNLWSVRFMRYISVLLLVIGFLWWVLLLVCIFVSPPGMHSRGSGFFDFSYATLTVGTLLIAILFFATPSKAARVSLLIIAVLLLANIILIVSIPRVRVEEGWVGISSVVWATLVAIWCVVTDRVVAWGKAEEEERLTGREETRRTPGEWIGVMISTVFLIVIGVVVLLLSAVLILRARDASLAAPGERYPVDNDKYSVHLFCAGLDADANGKRVPTVLFEAGERPAEGGLIPFAENALINRTISRYCYWDRPGFGWSDNAPSPFSAGMAADALSEALARAGEEGPWILVSAGVGSIYSRIFSARHVQEVKGMLLIDGLHEDLLYRIGSPGRGFRLWARGVMSPLGLDRLSGALLRGRTREDRVYGRSAHQGGKYIKARLQENLVANSFTKNEVAAARNIQTPNTPLVVISSGIELRKDSEWERKQRDLTHLSDNLVAWDVVNKAPHQVWETLEGRQVIEERLGQLVKG